MQVEFRDSLQRGVRLNLLDVSLVVIQRWKQLIYATAFCCALGVLTSYFVLKPSYSSVSVILPPPPLQSMSTALYGQSDSPDQTSDLSAHANLSADTYVGLLNSRTLQDRIIRKFGLQTRWRLKSLRDTRMALKSEVQIETTDFHSIQINVLDHDAKLAADLANDFVQQVNATDTELAGSEAAHRRGLFEQEVQIERSELVKAQEQFKQTQQNTDLISPDKQVSRTILGIGQLQTEIADRKVDLESMRSYATDQNPEVIRLRSAIDALQGQLKLLQNHPYERSAQTIQLPASQIADETLKYQRALRDVTRHGDLFDLLTSQFAAARIDMAQAAPVVPIVDYAVVADKKSGPRRSLIWLASCWVGLSAALLAIFLRQAIAHTRHDQEKSAKLIELLKAIGLHHSFLSAP